MNPYSNPNNGLNNQSVSRNQKEEENTPNYFQQFPQMNENQNNQLNTINLNNMLNQNNLNNQLNQNTQQKQQTQNKNLSQIKQIQEKSEMMCQQRDQRQPKLSYTIDHNPSDLKSQQTYLNETKREIETKPKHSTEVELLGQRLKRTQVERKELVKAILHAYHIVENFEHEPEENEKVLFAYEMIEQACSKLKRGVQSYLQDYVEMKNIVLSNVAGDEEDERIIKKLSEWTCSENARLTKCFDTYNTVFDENNFFEAIRNKVNINVVVKDCNGNIFGCHVSCAPTQKNLAVVDKTHFIFSLKNVNTPGSAAKQFFPRKAVESFVVFYKSNYVFCVPYAFAIGPYGKSAISPRLERVYYSKDSNFKCSFEDINSTTMPDTFPIEWVKVFVQ